MASMEQVIVVSMSPDVQAEFDRIKTDLFPVVRASQALYACVRAWGDELDGPCHAEYQKWRDAVSELERKIAGL